MPIKNWSTTPASNNAAPPFGAPEGHAPSATNDIQRQVMADNRVQWELAEWFDFGDTVSRASATTFKIASDVTTRFLANRRVLCYDSSTLYGTVVSSSYSAPDTTITLELDSGSLSTSLSSVALATTRPNNVSIPSSIGRKSADIASADTTNITTAGDFVDITGTTTISAIATANTGILRTTRFTSTPVVKYNATSVILPGNANITAEAGDVARWRSLGSGNWVCEQWAKRNGTYVFQRKSADIASAGTTDLSTATGEFVDVTGTTTITALGTVAAGRRFILRFNGALTFTHNATSLILPGGANITTASGDTADVVSLGSGNFLCVRYTRANAAPLGPYIDTSPIVAGSSDATKKLRLEVDGLTTATTRVWTAPDNDIDFTNGAFYVYESSGTSINNNSNTKITFDTELFDVNGWFDSATNNRYTPLVAGKYLISLTARFNSTNASCNVRTLIFKNGSTYAEGSIRAPAANTEIAPTVIAVVDMNGSTDYIEGFAFQDGGAAETVVTGPNATFM